MRNGYLSNWYACKFTVDGIEYNSSEQYMMEQKAVLFNDQITRYKILTSSKPKEQKSLGRTVKGFKMLVWLQECERIMIKGLIAKFQQNPTLHEKLLSSEDSILVEASPYDKVWGIYLHDCDPRAKTMAKWQGQNLLGYILMVVRDYLRQDHLNIG